MLCQCNGELFCQALSAQRYGLSKRKAGFGMKALRISNRDMRPPCCPMKGMDQFEMSQKSCLSQLAEDQVVSDLVIW